MCKLEFWNVVGSLWKNTFKNSSHFRPTAFDARLIDMYAIVWIWNLEKSSGCRIHLDSKTNRGWIWGNWCLIKFKMSTERNEFSFKWLFGKRAFGELRAGNVFSIRRNLSVPYSNQIERQSIWNVFFSLLCVISLIFLY